MSDFLNGKLDNQEIRNRLSGHKYSSGFKPSEKLLDDILDKFWFHDFYNSFIAEPIFLEHLIRYLNNVKPKKFNRFNFYQFLFNQVAKQKNKRSAIQQIALTFEKSQTDSISLSDYEGLFKTINVPKGFFDLAWMQKNHLARIEEKEGEKYFIWEHHTITEFLTAEYVLQDNNPSDVLLKLAVLDQEGVIAFKPSWSGVLRFLLESSKSTEIFQWFISFLNENKDNIDDNLAELLIFIDTNIAQQTRKNIFNLIYDSYFDRIVWLPVWTRSRIAKFVDAETYKRLKKDIKSWSNMTETFVRRGNVVSVIDGLLETKNELLNPREKTFWENKLINFANNPKDDGNGVLQRHSLSALAYFKDETIIPIVAKKCFEETQDSLVRDEFIQFCIISAPNSEIAIDYFIKGIKKGSTIYARHGLYKITSKKAIEYFIAKISQDKEFLKEFLKHESIFDKEGADQELIKNIGQSSTPKVIKELKKLVFTVMRIDDYYNEGQSKFLQQIVLLINTHYPKYLFEILEDAKKEKNEKQVFGLIYESKELLAFLITKENVRQYFDTLEGISDSVKRYAQDIIYYAGRLNGNTGEQAYKEAVKLGFIEKIDEDKSQKDFDEEQKKRKQKTYSSFLNQLEPEPGKYMPDVFKYFLQCRKDIEEQWREKDKKRLLKLAIDEGIKKIDPRKFKVKILSKHEGNNKFTWSTPASYYGDIINVLKELAPKTLIKNRQSIIDFIPYDFDTGAVLDFIKELKDKDLEWVNKVMSDKKDDRRYLIPQTYIYLVGEYTKRGCKLPSVKHILRSFINDPQIQDYNQRSALENLTFFLDQSDTKNKKFLTDTFKNSRDEELKRVANGVLIAIYKDREAIDWRFKQLKNPLPFEGVKMDGEAHEVSPVENELDNMALAKPLIELRDEKYLPKFLDLLTYSFKVIEKKRDKKYWSYVNYLWRIVIAFVENLKENYSLQPLLRFEDWISKNATKQDLNWLKARVKTLKQEYVNFLGRSRSNGTR